MPEAGPSPQSDDDITVESLSEDTDLVFGDSDGHNEHNREDQEPAQLERLHKVLAHAGIASRRAAEVMMAQGRVEVDGEVVRAPGTKVDPHKAVIKVDGDRIVVSRENVYLALNKPYLWQSTMSDDLGRPCVGDIIRNKAHRDTRGIEQRLFHVGRLDARTEGLLILTNDGDLAHRLMHPSFGISKTYLVQVAGVLSKEAAKRLQAGVTLDDGPAKVDKLSIVGRNDKLTQISIVIHEGRKHIVRRMFQEVGFPVTGLVRTHIGSVALGDQRPGTLRVLNRKEIASLYGSAEGVESFQHENRPTIKTLNQR